MTIKRYVFLMWLVFVVVTSATDPRSAVAADQTQGVTASKTMPISDGSIVVFRKAIAEADSESVLVHFHGAPDVLRRSLANSRFCGTLVVVNFPGLSSAYAKPIAGDPDLFDRILRQTRDTQSKAPGPQANRNWEHIAVSAFSASYGAIRELLKSDRNMERIEAIATADSIYAGLEESDSARRVNAEHMQGFLSFARLAAEGRKKFVLSHSAQPTPYASTTETAGFLLRSLELMRIPETTIQRHGLTQQTLATKNGFVVLGFSGTTGPDHMRHLHNIDVLWNRCFSSKTAAGCREAEQSPAAKQTSLRRIVPENAAGLTGQKRTTSASTPPSRIAVRASGDLTNVSVLARDELHLSLERCPRAWPQEAGID